jgi:hypothetical protein
MLITNLGILIAPFILSIVYPEVGRLGGIVGSITGLFSIYALPTITNLKATYLEIQHPVLAEALKQNKF